MARSNEVIVNEILDDLDLERSVETEGVPEDYNNLKIPVNVMREERSVLDILVHGCFISW